ncbi:hypothetical protein ACFLTE_07135 [Bacteroidota bacterium]
MNPIEMFNWTKKQLGESSDFRKVMDYVKDQVNLSGIDFISGGRTRDWPFSAALSILSKKDALFLYKPEDGSNPLVREVNGNVYSPKTLDKANVFHIVDLVTTASSVTNSGGWVDQIRTLGGKIEQVYAIIDRNQGATQTLINKGAELQSAVQINPEWLKKYDPKNEEIVTEYLKDPQAWSINYLCENGIDCITPYLNPESPQAIKDNRLLKFVSMNNKRLANSGLLEKIIKKGDNFSAVEDKERGVNEGDDFYTALEKYE